MRRAVYTVDLVRRTPVIETWRIVSTTPLCTSELRSVLHGQALPGVEARRLHYDSLPDSVQDIEIRGYKWSEDD